MSTQDWPSGCDKQIDYLREQVQRIHDALNLHEWFRLYHPWDKDNERSVECVCGARQQVTREVYDAAREHYRGY